ncbi:MAG: FKBP-type peptidyl-prolyl cis-trans isomerase [Bacteroidales bacterium]|nr:FKBP-type peptidyl-prolyl cis-trans isomerase [Bacteroidales bacterium]
MKKTILYLAVAAAALCSCAKTPSAGLNDADKRYFDAWLKVNHPDATPTSLGAYVISETPGTGAEAGSADVNPHVRVDYVIRSLSGTVQETSRKALSQQLGTYSEGNYCGPEIWARANNGLPAGLEEAVSSMRVGGSKTVIVPGWLQTLDRYDSAAEYLEKASGTAAIYEIDLLELIPDIDKWETDSIGRYLSRHFPSKSPDDSLKYGFYYIRTGAPESETAFPNDTTIYINYIGRRLDGTVFDTNVKDTAKFYGIYSASRTYTPSSISWYSEEETYEDITMGSSNIIDGFAYALSQMHPYEKGTAVFYSDLGYGASGSGSTIPGYSPLRFDIEIVDQP